MNHKALRQQQLTLALSEWRHWSLPIESEPAIVERLSSGKTNQSYLLKAGDCLLVLRLEPANANGLGVDRHFEKKVLTALGTELCAKHIYASSAQCYSVFEYIQGRVWTCDDLKSTDQTAALERVILKMQKTDIVGSTFDYVSYLQEYQNRLKRNKISTALMRLDEFSFFREEFDRVLNKTWKPVLCHHDLGPDNIIETADGLKIIDWEYAGLGHPDFDRRYIRSLLYSSPEQGLKGDAMDKLIYWLNYYWGLVRG